MKILIIPLGVILLLVLVGAASAGIDVLSDVEAQSVGYQTQINALELRIEDIDQRLQIEEKYNFIKFDALIDRVAVIEKVISLAEPDLGDEYPHWIRTGQQGVSKW